MVSVYSIPSQKCPQSCLWNSFSVRLTDDDSLSSLVKQNRLALPLSTSISSRRSTVWYVLGTVPAGNISSSSTLQIFHDSNHLLRLLNLDAGLSARSFPLGRHVLKKKKKKKKNNNNNNNKKKKKKKKKNNNNNKNNNKNNKTSKYDEWQYETDENVDRMDVS